MLPPAGDSNALAALDSIGPGIAPPRVDGGGGGGYSNVPIVAADLAM
ncbi:Uncharacterised protein [Mycobacteroides abscessus subsp. massiliense]|nr:Uncharacterised protein [Mycobacteroides abscessus subsp. massiliense]